MKHEVKFLSVSAVALLTIVAGAANAGNSHNAHNVSVETYGAKLSNAGQAALAQRAPEAIASQRASTVRQQSAHAAGPLISNRAAYEIKPAPAGPVSANSGAYVVNTAFANSAALQADTDRLRRLQQENENLRRRNEQLVRSSNSGGGANLGADLPPNAKSGECYARVLIPAKYESLTERVLDREGGDRVEIIPAEYTWDEQTVTTREASERIEVIPATYKNVTETIEVEPARTELKTVPARYENVSEKILVREAYTTWKKGSGPITKVDEATGEIVCLVEVPAEYRTVVRKELREPAKTEEVFIPAKTRTVTKRVLDRPASTRAVPIPAQYDTVRVRKLVRPAQERRIPIEATYKNVTKQRKISDEKLEWREILCETNTTPNVIRRVQSALRREGYNPGVADGVLGGQTLTALRAYQVDNNLPSGQLTIATVRRLGIRQ